MILKNTQTTKVWLMALSLLLAVNYAKAQIHTQDKALCVRADFVFALDISGSVSSEETQEVVNAFMTEIDRYVVDEDAIRIGFVVFNGGVVYEQALTGDEESINNSIRQISSLARGNSTNILEALEKAKQMFEYSFDERPNEIHRGLILLSDGDPIWHTLQPSMDYDLDDVKQQSFFYKEGVGMFVGQDAQIAQEAVMDKYHEVMLSRQIKNLSIYLGFEQKVKVFALNIAESEQPVDEEHLYHLASPQQQNDAAVFDEVEHYLGRSYFELLQWIDGLSICN
ncbi:VWA domain-containing protein [bacterium]|nr:VWA domain-containing protein [bacterium]